MAKSPAFPFVIEELQSSRIGAQVRINPMFGTHAVYVCDKVHFALRHKGDESRRDDGIWVVIAEDSVAAITKEFPSLRKIEIFQKMGAKPIPTWWNLPETAASFEEDAARLIDLVIQGDERLGKIPKSKLPKKKKPKPKPKLKPKLKPKPRKKVSKR